MNKYEVKAGYYEWNVYRNGELIYTIDDGSSSLAEHVAANDSGGLIPISELYALCKVYLAFALAAAHGEDNKPPYPLSEQTEVERELFTAWARHFGYDEVEISEWNGSAVTNIAIVEDGAGKIHEFRKIIDEREGCTFDDFQQEVQSWADALRGDILAIYRKRDVIQRCWL